jgi:hypothetical protein
MKLDDIASILRENLINPEVDFWQMVCEEAKQALSDSQNSKIETANEAWFLNKVAVNRRLYVQCFHHIRRDNYYEAWRTLERIEIDSGWLLRNPFHDVVEFKVERLLRMVNGWQALFPYKLFFSPALLKKRVECSLCGKIRNPWSDCRHVLGRVYEGRECVGIVTEVDLLEVSLVADPVQKYSVAFLDQTGDRVDHHDYHLVRFVADRLHSPFDKWRMYWTSAYHPHHLYPDVKANNACPCGSGRAFKDCCQNAPGVLRPHAQILFEKDPPGSLPSVQISGYSAALKDPS